jgi:protein-S-isoprenylcysteine O-methyltransferase Ste14
MLKVLSILGYVCMAGGLLALLMTHLVLSSAPLVLCGQALAIALMIWARITFGRRSFHLAANPTAGGLVTNGPYRYMRHPIYAAVCLFTLAGVAAHLELKAVLLAGVVIAGAGLRIYCEETLLKSLYPEYLQYAAKTRRVVPFVF